MFPLQATGVFLSDIPRYDLCSDYILLAEQRQAEADLKDKYERLTLELQVRHVGCHDRLLGSSYHKSGWQLSCLNSRHAILHYPLPQTAHGNGSACLVCVRLGSGA